MAHTEALSRNEALGVLVSAQGLGTTRRPWQLEEAVSSLFAIQTQYGLSLPVALAARCSFKPKDLDRALNHERTLVKTWSLRYTLHVHHARSREILASALGAWQYQRYVSWMLKSGETHKTVAERDKRIIKALGGGPLTRVELHERVPELKGLPWAGWGQDVKWLAVRGDIVLAPNGPGPTRFGLASEWFGGSIVNTGAQAEARLQLFMEYLRSHSPASIKDFAYWSGLSMRDAKEAADSAGGSVLKLRIEGMAEPRYALREALERRDSIRGVRLLAKFDPLIMGHRDKSLVLANELLPKVSRQAGQVEATVLLNGKVAGTWRLARTASRGTVIVEPYRRIGSEAARGIQREARHLSQALGLREIEVQCKPLQVI